MTLQNSLDIFRSHGVMETCCWPENSIEEGSLSPLNSPVSLGISACPDAQQAASCQKPCSNFRHAVPKIIKSPKGTYFNSNLRAILLPIRIIVWTCMDCINHGTQLSCQVLELCTILRRPAGVQLEPHALQPCFCYSATGMLRRAISICWCTWLPRFCEDVNLKAFFFFGSSTFLLRALSACADHGQDGQGCRAPALVARGLLVAACCFARLWSSDESGLLEDRARRLWFCHWFDNFMLLLLWICLS